MLILKTVNLCELMDDISILQESQDCASIRIKPVPIDGEVMFHSFVVVDESFYRVC